MYEIRIIGRKKNGDCIYGHFGQASHVTESSVTFSQKCVIRGVGGN